MDADYELPLNSDLDIRNLQRTLDLKWLTTSYKPFWFWAFLDVLETKSYLVDYNSGNFVNFKDIAKQMMILAWVPSINYRLNFGVSDKLGESVLKIYDDYSDKRRNLDYIQIERIIENAVSENPKYVESLLKYVPFRFLVPFYENQLKGLKDNDKNFTIRDLSNEKPSIYTLHKDGTLEVPKQWYQYLITNKSILSSWVKYKLIKYFERRNPNVPAISSKLDLEAERNLSAQRKLWDLYLSSDSLFDYLTGNKIDRLTYHLDHYIPWSFVQHNQLWNLCPLNRESNLKKSDSLPDWNKTSEIFIDNQFSFYKYILNKKNKSNLEDYLYILNELNEFKKEDFYENMEKQLKPLWQIAKNMGF